MEDQEQERRSGVRSRWTPKPEQIVILESIFNSGMVNPPKDETARIRNLLEKFGSVADANIFYWFQNRRSRSRRRQRQLQATLAASASEKPRQFHAAGAFDGSGYGYHVPNQASYHPITADSPSSSSSSFGPVGNGNDAVNSDGFVRFSGQLQELHQGSLFGHQESSNLHYQSGAITVFINGVATEVGRGAVDMKAMFGGDYALFHSSGVGVESLQHGESYFLVPRHSS